MHIQVRPSDPLPIYRQIMAQIQDAVMAGSLTSGTKLPSHRDLATMLVIAPLTVKKAYDELEKEGIVETRRGRGTFIVEDMKITRRDRRQRLEAAAEEFAAEATLLGFEETDALDVARSKLKKNRKKRVS